MEGVDDEMRTLECLRGRLIAERAASKIARETAELMENKLADLEKLIKAEMKYSKKAERKLNFLKKKVESLNLYHLSKNFDTADCSSFVESSACGSSSTVAEKSEKDQNDTTSLVVSREHNSAEITSSPANSSLDQKSSDGSHVSDYNMDHPQNPSESKSNRSSDDPTNDDHSLKSSMGEKEITGQDSGSGEDDGSVDNSLALILVQPYLEMLQEQSHKDETRMVNYYTSVGEVLDALRLAKEKLQSTMDRRNVNQFGYIVGTQICS